ncbi:MAG: radical SAM protein [Ruminococcaceae bacterium]|nr:radical SAM protein [Oscillospiraceae bacterium]
MSALCYMCPRECGARRGEGEKGFCGQTDKMLVSRIALHPYEEPPISGERGSGTVFFCGCSLGCVFCQNKDISRGSPRGTEYSPEELAEKLLELEANGAHNVNLVTSAHFATSVAQTLEIARKSLKIPVVYNSSGYEKIETLRLLDGLVDVYLPDFKYYSSELSEKYSSAPDYAEVATKALGEMYRQVGECVYDKEGLLKRGMIVRHLVLPTHRDDSKRVLEHLASILPTDKILLSLMSQYTPDFALDQPYRELHRRLTSFEYRSVADTALELGFDGFFQERSSAKKDYTPNFKQ